MNYIQTTYYRNIKSSNALGIEMAHAAGPHWAASVGAHTTSITLFNLSDCDLMKLRDQIEDAMRHRNLPVPSYFDGHEEGRLLGQSEGYNEGRRDAFHEGSAQLLAKACGEVK